MSREVPDQWRVVRLGEIARETRARNGSREIPQDRLVGVFKGEGMIPTRDRVRGESIDRCKIVRPGAFAYNPMRLNIGSIARWHGSEPAIVSPDYVVFEADPAQLDEAFLDHLRSSAPWRKFTESAGDGGVRVRIYFDHLAEFRFPLPPLPEQRRIAEILSSVDEAAQATQGVIEQTRKVKQGVLERLLTKGIGHTRFKQTEIGEIPEEWKAAPVGEIIRLTSGKLKSSRSLHPQQTRGAPYPVYGGNGITGYDSEFLVDGERIVIGRVGAYCGNIYRSSGKIWITDNALYTREFLVEVDPDFLSYALVRIPLARIRGGGCQPLISQKPLYEQFVALPQIGEQRHIAEIVNTFDILDDGKGMSRLQLLKIALMSDLLTGRKRISTDLPLAAE
jgi:type I restriction enzyme S subunit